MKTRRRALEPDENHDMDPDEFICKLRDKVWYYMNHGLDFQAKEQAFYGAYYSATKNIEEHVWHFHALLQFIENDFEGAEKLFSKALELITGSTEIRVRHIQVWEDYIIILESLHKYMQGYRLLEHIEEQYQSIKQKPPVRFFVRAAIICRDIEKYEEVRTYVQKAKEVAPDDPIYLTNELVQLWEGHLLSSDKDPYKGQCLKEMTSILESMENKLPEGTRDAILMNNLGVLHYLKKEYKKSIEYLDKSLAINPEDPEAYFNKGLAEFRSENYEAAKDAFQQARTYYLKKHQPGGSRNAELFVNLSEMKLRIRSNEEEEETEFVNFLFSLLDTIDTHRNFFIQRFQSESQFYESLLSGDMRESVEGKFVLLRGWHSNTPPSASVKDPVGGGYFLRWRGAGVVVDPGFHFVRNFLERGLSIMDIDAIILTSCMLDHSNDFEALLSLLKVLKDLRQTAIDEPHSIDPFIKEKVPPIDKKIDLMLTTDAEDKFKTQIENTYKDVIGGKKRLDPDKQTVDWRGINGDGKRAILRLTSVKNRVFHNGDWDRPVGIVLDLLKDDGSIFRKIGYTSDTMWINDLENRYENCDILVAHMGPIRATEFKSEGSRDEKLAREHLGLFGCFRLIKNQCPKLFVIADMGPELARRKSRVVSEFNKKFWHGSKKEDSTKIVSSDLGMIIDLSNLSIKTDTTKKFVAFSDIEEKFDVRVGKHLYA